MVTTFLHKVLNRDGRSKDQREAFSLPNALFAGVRVLLFASDDHTDLLFAMPLVEEIRDRFPEAMLGLVSDEVTSQLALSSGQFQELIVHSSDQLNPRVKGFEHLRDAVKAEAWDITILLGRDPDPGREELALASGAKLRLGPAHDRSYPRINCAVRSSPNVQYPYRRTATWGRLFGLPLEHAPLHWPVPDDRMRQMGQLVHFNKPRKDQLLIGVDPGVGKEGTVLSGENLAFVMNHLGAHLRSKTIVLSADPAPERLAAFSGLLTIEQLDLPRPSLLEMILLLAQCDLFVAGNTDLFHFAVAMGVPSLGIFTGADEERWVPEEADGFSLLRPAEGSRLELAELMAQVDRLLS